jgi:uncharacterized protein
MNSAKKKTLVIGASDNPERYSYMAMHRLQQHGHPVVAIGRNAQTVLGVPQEAFKEIDTVTLYVSPAHQKEYYQYILSLHPQRIIFNPGAENEELEKLANEKGIQTMEACTLVLLSTGQY